ncbi:MAG TPA: cellulose synthase [Streptosporangiaceae bacterium]|nr:cellulose synthase [Streptosporangiaceae bacterium]
MNTWNSIAWFPICVGLTGAGLVLSWFTWRRKGLRRGIRAAAWSLLPLALYLTGSILLVGRIGSAIVQFSSSFVFSPKTWAGVVLFGLAAVIFLTSGGIPLLSSAKRRARKKELKQQAAVAGDDAAPVTAGSGSRAVAQVGAGQPAKAAKPAKRAKGGGADDDGLDPDVAEILRRHGIS